jgi:hypothetical protein
VAAPVVGILRRDSEFNKNHLNVPLLGSRQNRRRRVAVSFNDRVESSGMVAEEEEETHL